MDLFSDINIIGYIVFFMGALVQGATGFGFALVATPLMVSLIETDTLIVLVLTLSLFISGLMSWNLKKHVDYSLIKYMTGASIVGSFLGSTMLNTWGDLPISKLIIAFFVIIFSLLIHFDVSKPLGKEKLGGAAAGLFSGFFATLTSFGGPPVVLLLSNQKKHPLVFKGTISLYFFINGIFSILILILVTNVRPEAVFNGIIFLPVVFLGWKTGYMLANRIPLPYFRPAVLFIIMAAAFRILLMNI